MAEGEPACDDLKQIEKYAGDPEGLKQALKTQSKVRIDLDGENGSTVGYAISGSPWPDLRAWRKRAAPGTRS